MSSSGPVSEADKRVRAAGFVAWSAQVPCPSTLDSILPRNSLRWEEQQTAAFSVRASIGRLWRLATAARKKQIGCTYLHHEVGIQRQAASTSRGRGGWTYVVKKPADSHQPPRLITFTSPSFLGRSISSWTLSEKREGQLHDIAVQLRPAANKSNPIPG